MCLVRPLPIKPLNNPHPDTRSRLRLRLKQRIEPSQPGRNPVLDLAWREAPAWVWVLAVVGLVVVPGLLDVAEEGGSFHLGVPRYNLERFDLATSWTGRAGGSFLLWLGVKSGGGMEVVVIDMDLRSHILQNRITG